MYFFAISLLSVLSSLFILFWGLLLFCEENADHMNKVRWRSSGPTVLNSLYPLILSSLHPSILQSLHPHRQHDHPMSPLSLLPLPLPHSLTSASSPTSPQGWAAWHQTVIQTLRRTTHNHRSEIEEGERESWTVSVFIFSVLTMCQQMLLL